jgi:hypothetical protein
MPGRIIPRDDDLGILPGWIGAGDIPEVRRKRHWQVLLFVGRYTYDAVQLAVALRIGRAVVEHPCTMVSGDATLLSAARAEGLTTETPFDYVAPEERPGHTG